MDPVSNAVDPTQLLRVQVEQFTRSLSLVTDHDWLGLEIAQPTQSEPV
jgi:hypothetical protein